MLESNLPRDNLAGLIETMCFGTGRAIDVPPQPVKFIGLIDPLCLPKLPPEGRNDLKPELKLLLNL